MRRVLLVVLAVALVAGCLQPKAPAVDASPAAEVPVTSQRMGAAVGPDLNATTAAPPRLIEGEWWRIKFSGYLASNEELVRVVANATPGGYVMGMPHAAWMKEAIAFHAPAFGEVGRDLSYDTHNRKFQPLRFPLRQGDTWETAFANGTMEATVVSADQYTAHITLQPPPSPPQPTDPALALLLGPFASAGNINLTYDARQHEIVHMDSAIGSWDVVAHGFAFAGWVTVPAMVHTAIDYGVFPGATDVPQPTRTVHVDPMFNRITVVQAAIAVTPGVVRVSATPPDKQEHVTQQVGAPGMSFSFFEVADPGGDWTQQDVVAGVGATYTMGIAYQQYDILVPGGERRPTHSHAVER